MAEQELLKLLEDLNSTDENRAREASEYLWKLDDPAYVPILYDLIEHNSWDFVVDAAASRLVRIEEVSKPIPVLFSAIERLWDDYARHNDISSLLKNIGYVIGASEDAAYLLKQLQSPNSITRELAVLFLCFLDEQISLEPLLAVLRSSDESRVRVMAVSSLGQLVGAEIRNQTAFKALVEASYDPDPGVRSAAVYPLSLTCHPEAREVLQRARGDESELVQRAAIDGMKRWRMNGCGEI
jgi:HEAT repeat protein